MSVRISVLLSPDPGLAAGEARSSGPVARISTEAFGEFWHNPSSRSAKLWRALEEIRGMRPKK
jgi:hypothetical protein